jgi:hypothetical protein
MQYYVKVYDKILYNKIIMNVVILNHARFS